MTRVGLLHRLESGHSVNHTYRRGEIIGRVAAWLHDGSFILTWEECHQDDFHDDSRYLRDERHVFASAREALAFIEQSGLAARDFRP